MVELLSDDPTLSQDQREYINSISLSANALLAIVNDILDFSKIESGRLDIEEVPFSLADTVGELCKLLEMFAQQKSLNFIYENYMDPRLEVFGDPGRIRQVLSNLLTNALKFTTQGTVKISVTSKAIKSTTMHDDALEVVFIIEDTGIGIEKHVLDTLFKPFRQGDSSTARLFGGTGLGLTISRNVSTLYFFPTILTKKLACYFNGWIYRP
jgi:signal transduction histidine kinase